MAGTGSGALPADDFQHSVDDVVAELVRDYNRYCLTENADPEAYTERIRYLLEELQTAPERDPVSAAAFPVFLERVAEREEE